VGVDSLECFEQEKVGRKAKYKRRKEVEKIKRRMCTKIKFEKKVSQRKENTKWEMLLRKRKRRRRKRKKENPKREFVIE
jgi:hypothetical protein